MTTVQTPQLPTAENLRAQARDALNAVGARADLGQPGGHGLQASTPITGEVLFTVAETTPEQADAAIAQAAQAFTTWRTTPAPPGARDSRSASAAPARSSGRRSGCRDPP